MTKSKTSKTKTKTANKTFAQVLLATITSETFGKFYSSFALLVLIVSSLFWSLLGAKIQSGNADQLVNSYLFESTKTFHGAQFPAQHTFLLKWPVFYLIKLYGFSPTSFVNATLVLVLLSVGGLAIILHKIERHRLVFGTICLALASSLLLVPSQPYPGGILPVNMAMITTRNLEYVLYILCLCLLARLPKIKSWRFWLAAVLLSLLVASDKLFLTISIGGAFFAAVIYLIARKWVLMKMALTWLLAGIIAGFGATGILLALSKNHVVRVVSSSTLGPYSSIHTLRDLVLGLGYGFSSVLTNFGANPVTDPRLTRQFPSQIHHAFLSFGGAAYLINGLVLIFGVFASSQLIFSSLRTPNDKIRQPDTPARLAIMLIWTSLAAGLAFIATSHYYPVDARYLAVTLFTGFIAIVTYLRNKQIPPFFTVFSGLVIFAVMIFGSTVTIQNYLDERAALVVNNERNARIAQVLRQHSVDVLVGDYWRVVPTKLLAQNHISIMPMSNCFQPRDILTSANWVQDLHNRSFAYLLSFDSNLTNSPRCSLEEVIKIYGRPNGSALISGSLAHPNEVLLFYDKGIGSTPPAAALPTRLPGSVVPVTLSQLRNTSCPTTTILNIVAHQDDDLLFISPDVIHAINGGYCVRTVYLTAGDAGSGEFYWLAREKGSQAAYSYMAKSSEIWLNRIVKLSDYQFITIATPRDNPKISLIFMHLPDGNLGGQGFKTYKTESLEHLEKGKIKFLHSVDGQSYYTSEQLVEGLSAIIRAYRPAEIRTQSTHNNSLRSDHSDHRATGLFTKQAFMKYSLEQYDGRITAPIKFYSGYPISLKPENVFGHDLKEKEKSFLDYSRYDPGVCLNASQPCKPSPTYNEYLQRQYQEDGQ